MRRERRAAAWSKGFTWALFWLASAGVSLARLEAATPLESIQVSPDITVELGPATVDDETVVADDLTSTVVSVNVGTIPAQTDLDAYHLLPNGEQLLSFDTTVELFGGLTVEPADVVRYEALSGTYTMVFDASQIGIPSGANVDAVAMFAGSLLLSFDITLDIGGLRFDDEDLVRFDGAQFTLFFDGSTAGVPAYLDLDAAHYLECANHLLLSFDGSGTFGSLAFDDEDFLEYDRVATWEMAFDGSAHHVDWPAGDLNAAHATVDFGPGTTQVFGQVLRAAANKIYFVWPNPVAFRAVRGSFGPSVSVGAYAVNEAWSGNGTFVADPSTPASGAGYWYLVKPAGCQPTSWQSSLSAEPGRDSAIP